MGRSIRRRQRVAWVESSRPTGLPAMRWASLRSSHPTFCKSHRVPRPVYGSSRGAIIAPGIHRIMQLLALETAKRLNTVAQGRREAAHPGTGLENIVYAEGVTQPIVGTVLFNPFRVTVRLVSLANPGCGRRGDRPWATVCNASGVCRDCNCIILFMPG